MKKEERKKEMFEYLQKNLTIEINVNEFSNESKHEVTLHVQPWSYRHMHPM